MLPRRTSAAPARAALAWIGGGLALVAGAALLLWALEVRSSTRAPVPAAPAAEPPSPPLAPAVAMDPTVQPLVDLAGTVLPPDHRPDDRLPLAAVVRGLLVAAPDVALPPEAQVELAPQGNGGATPRIARIRAPERAFRFDEVPFGDWKVRLKAPGYQDFTALVTTSTRNPDVSLVLPLVHANRISGRVLDAAGRPVGGLTVTAQRITDAPDRAAAALRGVTDADGYFTILGAELDRYRVHPGEPRNPLGPAVEIHLAGAEAWASLAVPLTGRASVVVSDVASGAPLPGVKVVAARIESGAAGFSAAATTTPDGRIAFPHLPPGEYAFTAYGAEQRRTVVRARVEADQGTEVTIAMLPLAPASPR